jgi:AAA+ superfamily predicted ATPase
VTRGPYETNAAHLRDELARVDLLVRAQVVRWRRTIAAAKPPDLWGMMQISDAEIEQYLATVPGPPGVVPESLAEMLRPFWNDEAEAAADILLAVSATPPGVDLRVERLRTRFALDDAELDVILLALLPELDLRYRRIFGYLQDDASRASPPPDLIGEMLHPKAPTLEEKNALFDPSGALLRWRLVSVADRAVRLDPRVASFLLGRDGVDRALARFVRSLQADVPFDKLFADAATVAALRDFAEHGAAAPVVILQGPDGSGRAHAARAICHARGLRLLQFDVEQALRDPAQWDAVVALAYREALLQNAALYFTAAEKLDPPLLDALLRTAGEMPVLTFVERETAGESARQSRCLRFQFSVPHYELRRAVWLQSLPAWADRAEELNALAAAFQLTGGQIHEAIAAAETLARRRSATEPRMTLDDLYESCRRQSGRRLLGFARRIEPTRGMSLDDVILSRSGKRQLREVRNRVRLRPRLAKKTGVARGEGLLVLFAGPSGTGKTLAAEAIASEQGVDLYKVDASSVVSKWVGETEQNLSRVFAEAEGSDALLFFDECDSLFGQRGEINDAQDRWANQQINYLLQRVEDYAGVIILATNLRSNIDEAFARRIQSIVEFALPDAALRLELWKRSLQGWSGLSEEEELPRVADRFSLSGGSIRNIAIEAMFRALAKERETLALRDVVASVAREYQKLGRPITKGEFGEPFYGWVLADVIAPETDQP